VHTLNILADAIHSGKDASILKSVVVPRLLQNEPAAAQATFLSKALRDEISQAGIAALNRLAIFGSLTNLFPNEGIGWADQAGVKPLDCVAFRMERNGIRAEVVLARTGDSYQVVRCNNVREMAGGK
jgi:hypothetical protein